MHRQEHSDGTIKMNQDKFEFIISDISNAGHFHDCPLCIAWGKCLKHNCNHCAHPEDCPYAGYLGEEHGIEYYECFVPQMVDDFVKEHLTMTEEEFQELLTYMANTVSGEMKICEYCEFCRKDGSCEAEKAILYKDAGWDFLEGANRCDPKEETDLAVKAIEFLRNICDRQPCCWCQLKKYSSRHSCPIQQLCDLELPVKDKKIM